VSGKPLGKLMQTDPIADFLTKLRNASRVGKAEVELIKPARSLKAIAKLLATSGYIAKLEDKGGRVQISLDGAKPLLHARRVSRPGVRRYVQSRRIPIPHGTGGLVILSTPKGILSGAQARKQKVGGELICEVW